MSLTSFSQNATQSTTNIQDKKFIQLPIPVAKKIAQDLVDYDGVKLINKTLVEKCSLMELSIANRDSIIATKSIIINNYQFIQNNQSIIIEGQEESIKSLQRDLQWEKVKFRASIGLGVTVAVVAVLLIK